MTIINAITALAIVLGIGVTIGLIALLVDYIAGKMAEAESKKRSAKYHRRMATYRKKGVKKS